MGKGESQLEVMNDIIYFNGDLDDVSNSFPCDLGMMGNNSARFFVNNTIGGFYKQNQWHEVPITDGSNMELAPVFADTNTYALD